MPAREQACLGNAPFHTWEFPDGRVWAEFHRSAGEVTIRFPGLADFALPPNGGIPACRPVPGLTEATREHLYLNQVLPLVQGRSGFLTFHASAVAVGTGAVAFVGRTGRGKSTLAAAFATGGHPFLTDDGLTVIRRDGAYLVEPSHPSLRLWEDSREALIAPGTAKAEPVSYTDKPRFLAGGGLPFSRRPQPLRAAYFLGEEVTEATAFTPMDGAGLLMEWVQHSFLLDLDDPAALGAHFAAVTAFSAAIPCYRLDYPRRYQALDEVRRAILEHATGDHRR